MWWTALASLAKAVGTKAAIGGAAAKVADLGKKANDMVVRPAPGAPRIQTGPMVNSDADQMNFEANLGAQLQRNRRIGGLPW